MERGKPAGRWRTPATSPPARYYGALAYDPIRHQTVLFGGVTAAGSRLADTWVWDGTNWTQKAGGPPARSSTRLVFDAPRNQILMFGGATSDTNTIGDTWVWNGTSWTQLSPAVSPSSRAGQGMVYDEARQQVMLFGGVNEVNSAFGTLLNDTWVWNGSWTKLSPVNAPEVPRDQMAIAFDGVAQQVVLFAGYGGDFSKRRVVLGWFQLDQEDLRDLPDRPGLSRRGVRHRPAATGRVCGQRRWAAQFEHLSERHLDSFQQPESSPVSLEHLRHSGGREGSVVQYAPGQPGPSLIIRGSPVPGDGDSEYGLRTSELDRSLRAGAGTCIATMSAAAESVTANFGPARTWTEVFPAVSPNTNNGEFGAMAYDKARNQMVLIDEQSAYLDLRRNQLDAQKSRHQFEQPPAPTGVRRGQCSNRGGRRL